MADTTPESGAEKALENVPNLINAEIDAAQKKIKSNKIISTAIIVGLVIMICVTGFLLSKEKGLLTARETRDDAIMKNMQDSVKIRDAHILSIEKNMKAQDAVIAETRDSIAKAYAIIKQLKKNQIIEIKAHEKDSIAISNLSLLDKIRFITGGQR